MSFRFDIGARGRSASRLIGNLRSDLLAALVQYRCEKGLTQQQLAELVGISRSDLNQYLSGQKELTLRSAADIAFVLDKEIHMELRDPDADAGGNYFKEEPELPVARQMRPRETVTWSSSRAMRIFVTQTSSEPSEQDD